MEEMNTMNNQEMNQDTVPAVDTNGLVGLAVKGAIGVVSLFTAYKIGKRSKAEEKDKPKKKLHFQSPIVLVEKEQQEEEKTEEEVKKEDQKETKKK